MYRRHGDKLAFVFLACDLLVTALMWVGAYVLRYELFPSPHGVPEAALMFRALPLVLLLAAIAYRVCGLYEVHRLRQLPRELGVICTASGLLLVLAITVAFYRRDGYESRLGWATFWILNAVALTVVRRCVWQMLKYFRGRGLNYGRAIIIGSGRNARRTARTIIDSSWTGLEAIGFVDTPPGLRHDLLPSLGELNDLERVVDEHDIDHVLIALPLRRYGELPALYRRLSDMLVDVQLVPDVPNVAGMRLQTVDIEDVSFIGARQNPHYGPWLVTKRAMDLALGSLALVALAPLMLVLAVGVKLSSPGPIFFRQTRAGLRGRPFSMFKFRSMRVDAEQATGPVWAQPADDRCTPWGRFMRRWSLDELPQLFNVLAGHMSLVGPRPERGVFVEKFRKQIPGYQQRHLVKAGMTGWAQVNGWRGRSSLRRRVQCDLYYIAHWSLWLDLKILLLTLVRGLRQPNAY